MSWLSDPIALYPWMRQDVTMPVRCCRAGRPCHAPPCCNILMYKSESLTQPMVGPGRHAPWGVGRILRPFCHFLGIGLPEELRLPKRERVRGSDRSPRPVPGEQRWAEAHPTALRDERSEMIVPNRRLPP